MVSAGVHSLRVRGVPWVRSRSLMVSAFSGSPCPVVPAGLGPVPGVVLVSSFPASVRGSWFPAGGLWVR